MRQRSRIAVGCLLVAAALLATVSERVAAQGCTCPSGWTCPEGDAKLPYSGDAPANCLQSYRVFLPDEAVAGIKPPEGWPVVIMLDLALFTISNDTPCIDPASFAGQALQEGIAVVTATASVASLPGSWPCAGVPPGHGMFHPPGKVVDKTNGVPISPTVTPYDEPAWSMPEKDAVMLVQHVRYYAGGVTDPTNAFKLATIDRHKIAVLGGSAGAIALMWTTFGPDRRYEKPFSEMTDPQATVPTRPDYAILHIGAVWWPIFAFDIDSGSTVETHFSYGGDTDLPADMMGQALASDLEAGSALRYEEPMFNDQLPLLMNYSVAGFSETSICTDVVGTAYPTGPVACGIHCCFSYCFVGGGQEDHAHPSWSGYAWENRYPFAAPDPVTGDAMSLLLVTNPGLAQKPANSKAHPPIVDLDTDSVTWLRKRMDAPFNPWKTITKVRIDDDLLPTQVAVAGTPGLPVLTGAGPMTSGQNVSLTLTNALPGAAAYLVVGMSQPRDHSGLHNQPFRGGVLVPAPDYLISGLATDANGKIMLNGPLPPGLVPFTQVYFQMWISDTGAINNLAGSNALQGTVP